MVSPSVTCASLTRNGCAVERSADEPLVGSADLQSLADLGNSFEIVKGMKPVPFGKDTLLQLAVISLAPVAPLILTMIPLGELLDRFLHVVF